MNITYWTTFSKRKNSTKVPTGGTTLTNVFIKREGSILSPSFSCNAIPKNATYIYVADFGRYYFIDNVDIEQNNLYRFNCSCDVLATYKSTISALSADVEYTASSNNVVIGDPRNPPTKTVIEEVTPIMDLTDYGFTLSINSGMKILNAAVDAGVIPFEVTDAELATIMNTVFSQNFIDQIKNQVYDLKSILLSCIAVPYHPSTRIGQPGGMVVKGETILSAAYKANRLVHYSTINPVNIAFPSDNHNLGFTYLDKAPYTMAVLYLPFVGCVPLDVDIIAAQKSIIIDFYFDEATGDIIYRLSKSTGDYIATYSGNCASNIPISGASYNALGALSSGISMIGSAAQAIAGGASGNPALIASGALSAGSSALNMFTSLASHTQTNGNISSAIGSAAGLVIKAMVFTLEPCTWNVASEYKAISGMPYYKKATISTLSGYVQCKGASIDINGFDSERDQINSFLNTGFYYE